MAVLAVFVIHWEVRDRRFQAKLALTRAPIDKGEFVRLCTAQGADRMACEFLWDNLNPYYRSPLTPYPEDRLISQFGTDQEDLSDMVEDFAKFAGRTNDQEWRGKDDPTLVEFAKGMIASTSSR